MKDRNPLTGTYRQYEILRPASALVRGIALLETLNILEGYDLAALGDRTPDSMHLIIEAFRRAFDDRTSFLGDPDFQSMPTAQLIDKGYAAAWRKSISMTHGDPFQCSHPAAGLHSRARNRSRPRTIPYSMRRVMQCQLRIP